MSKYNQSLIVSVAVQVAVRNFLKGQSGKSIGSRLLSPLPIHQADRFACSAQPLQLIRPAIRVVPHIGEVPKVDIRPDTNRLRSTHTSKAEEDVGDSHHYRKPFERILIRPVGIFNHQLTPLFWRAGRNSSPGRQVGSFGEFATLTPISIPSFVYCSMLAKSHVSEYSSDG
jgi:hypothetical protein